MTMAVNGERMVVMVNGSNGGDNIVVMVGVVGVVKTAIMTVNGEEWELW